MKTYKDLPEKEREQLVLFPAYVSLLAATYHQHGMDKKEQQTAIQFTHVKTYECNPLLVDFYSDVSKDFEEVLIRLNQQLPQDKKQREEVIRGKLKELETILLHTDSEYARAMHESMESYKEHVGHAHQSILEYLIFPVPIKGLTR
jgi:hypothetical protein